MHIGLAMIVGVMFLKIELKINGKLRIAEVSASERLIDVLRQKFGLVSVTLVGAVVVAAAAGGETDERGHGCRCRDDLLGVAHVISFWTIGVDLRVVGFLPTGFRFSSGYFSVIFRLSLAAFRLLTTAFRLPKTNRLLRWISIRLAACEVSSGHLSLGCFLWYTRVPISMMIHPCTNLSKSSDTPDFPPKLATSGTQKNLQLPTSTIPRAFTFVDVQRQTEPVRLV